MEAGVKKTDATARPEFKNPGLPTAAALNFLKGRAIQSGRGKARPPFAGEISEGKLKD